jgi:DNA-binding transcriptional LysR family regulator
VRDRHSALEIEVSLNDSDVLLSDLKAGRIDAAVLVRPQGGGSSRLAWQNLAKQPFVLLMPRGTQAPQELGLIRYDTALTGGRIAAQYVRRAFPRAKAVMEVRSIDAIVAMVSAGLGMSIVPQPRKALLDAHGVREVRLKGGPTRQIAAVRRSADTGNRNIDAVFAALASAYAA